MDATLTIGEVAAAVGLKTSAVRYYERVGVLPEPERASGQRRYRAETIGRLRTIRAAQQAGFALAEIARLLRGAEDGRAAEELRVLAERRLPDVETLIERAEAMKRWLELAAECRCSTLDVCALFADQNVASRTPEAIRSSTAAPISTR
jgi:MerR family transcriptional regulator, redox-sensitive transcriptional activator SoxR